MAETKPGGVYKNSVGDGYHDANGKPVPAPNAAEVKERTEAAFDQAAFEAAVKAEVDARLARQLRASEQNGVIDGNADADPDATATQEAQTSTETLVVETERLHKKGSK
jgi:hypothetical protein